VENLEKIIRKEIEESARVKIDLLSQTKIISKIAKDCSKALRRGNKIVLCGNGGSAADAQHIAAEFIGRFSKMNRKSLSAIALTTNSSILTAVANDFSFSKVFSRQVEGIVSKGDILIAISTSGKSKNVIEAIKKAKLLGATTISLSGKNKSPMSKISDITLHVPSINTQRIQEAHITVGHLICSLVEKNLTK